MVTSYGLYDFPGGSEGEAFTCNVEDLDLIPGLGRSPGEGNDNPLQENSLDGGAWQATVHGVTKSQTQLSDFTFHTDGSINESKNLLLSKS